MSEVCDENSSFMFIGFLISPFPKGQTAYSPVPKYFPVFANAA